LKKKQLYEVEIKSMALIREGKKSFITYFSGGKKKTIVSNVMILYPQFTNPADKPVVNITPITEEEYMDRLVTKEIHQKQKQVFTKADVMKVEDYETLGN
jgi:hypothetical protein